MLPTSIIFIFRSGMQIWMLSSDSSCMWNTNWDFYHCSGKYYLKCIIHFFIRSYSNDDPLARKYKYILQKPFICTDENAYYCFFLAQTFDFRVLWTNSRRRFTCLKIHELHFTLVYLHVYVPKYMPPRLLYYIHFFSHILKADRADIHKILSLS